ncbi:YDR458C [Saccharomyces arboricola H-6]|uniref:YDR458C n=1 Tax=Saccharomyces arboricola (strain H-6 / AS 2.3317 / CBS 10644) TaxID=1160507 RepID=J8Q0H4_SACAR|nr:YDR458C [Saccharomyces arboricola H-6]
MEHRSLDPKSLKVSQLRRILVENDVTFPANARKPVLVKLFEEKVTQHSESSFETRKGKKSIQKAVKSETKGADRRKSLKSKKHELRPDMSKSVEDSSTETNKRKREESGKDNVTLTQVKEENTPKKKRKKRSKKAAKVLEPPSKPKLESEEPLVTLSSEVETRDENKKEFSVDKSTSEELKPELPNLKVSNEFLIQLNKELASATTESYDHSIKSTNSSSIRVETEEVSELATDTEIRNERNPIANADKEAQDEVDDTESKEVKDKPVAVSTTFAKQEQKKNRMKPSEGNKLNSKGRTRHFLENRTKRGIDIIRPLMAHLFIWSWNAAVYLSIVLPLLFGLWYREQRIRIGYCGHEQPMKSVALSAFPQTEQVDEFLQAYGPRCLVCPEHAACSSFMNIECEPGYELKSPILETYGIIPFSKYCIKDESEEKEVDELVWKVSEYLRKKNGQVNCGEGENLFESGETEIRLYDIFSHSRPSWESQSEFNEHWKNVLKILKNKEEIVWLPLELQTDVKGSFQSDNAACIYRSTSKKWVNLQCRLGADIQDGLKKYGGSLFIAVCVFFLIKSIQSTLDNYVQREQIIERLVKEATDELKNVKKKQDGEAFLTTVQLRTILLKGIPNIKEQNSLWSQTKDKIIKEQSENIEVYLVEENGEIMTCWEWKD